MRSMTRWATEIWAACALCFVILTLQTKRPFTTVADAPQSGPMVVKGRLIGPEDRRAPSGLPAVGWRGWVHVRPARGAGPSPNLDVCVQQNLADLAVSDGRATLKIAPELFGSMLVRSTWVDRSRGPDRGLQGPRVARLANIAEGTSPTVTPREPGWACPTSEASGGIREYREQRVRQGIEVFVSGCRVGHELLPCGGHHDEVSTNPARIGVDIVAWGGWGRAATWVALAISGLVLLARARGRGRAATAGERAQFVTETLGPYRAPTESLLPPPSPEAVPNRVPAALWAGLFVVLVGPAFGLAILMMDDFTSWSWAIALYTGPVVGLAAALYCLWLSWRAPLREHRRGFIVAMVMAIVGGAAAWLITSVVGMILELMQHPLGWYHR